MTILRPNGRRRAFPRAATPISLLSVLALWGAMAAALVAFSGQAASAEAPQSAFCAADNPAGATTSAGQSTPLLAQAPPPRGPAIFPGLSCRRCSPAVHYCVVNPMRNEYACAPLGTTACISAARTGWCPPGSWCWAGRCQ
jgi:hypothetical protein